LLESIDSALQTEDDSWLNDVERANLDSAMTWLRETLKDSDADRIRSAAQALNQLSTPLAARRMDSAVSKALAGRRLADFA
jgi:molecular chaperone HscA